MYRFRPFSNADPPALAAIWRSQPPQRGVMQPVSAALLEQSAFGKHYFDRQGLIVATRDTEPVGFVHAGFGPNESEDRLDTSIGATQLLMVGVDERESGLAADLLHHSEEYLQSRGAQVLYAGGIRPMNGFYLGLYGGSELPGVLASDPASQVLLSGGYQEADRVIILQRELSSFRPAISYRQQQIRREAIFQVEYSPTPSSWWDACTMGGHDRFRFELLRRSDRSPLASVWYWDVEPLAASWGLHSAGMFDLYVDPAVRRQGYATFLLGESFRELRRHGVALVEAQTMQHNAPALGLYERLGFVSVDYGRVFRKQ